MRSGSNDCYHTSCLGNIIILAVQTGSFGHARLPILAGSILSVCFKKVFFVAEPKDAMFSGQGEMYRCDTSIASLENIN